MRDHKSPWGFHPRVQLITIAELLDGTKIDMPPQSQTNVTFQKAAKAVLPVAENLELAIETAPDSMGDA